MSKFAVTKYIYTQDPSDDRGVAWTKYILDYIINGDGDDVAGDRDSVKNRLVKAYARKISAKQGLTIRQLFSVGEAAYDNFIEGWDNYIYTISKGTLDNNKYMRKLYDLLLGPVYNSFDIGTKKILSTLFYIGTPEDKPFQPDGFDVNQNYKNTTLGKTINEEDMQKYKVLVNFDFIPYDDVLKNKIREDNDLTFDTRNENLYEQFLADKRTLNYNIWPNLTPFNYYNKLFDRLNDLDAQSKEYSKYDYNGPDRDYDFIKNDYWKRTVDTHGNNIYLKRDQKILGKEDECRRLGIDPQFCDDYIPVTVDQATAGKEATCYDLGIKPEACNDYINAILNPDPDESVRLLSDFIRNNNNAFTNIKKYINEIHPELAIVILKRFGFKINKKYEIISVGTWLKYYLRDFFSDEQLDALIKRNKKILDFLDYLVRFINYNPHILDPNAKKLFREGEMEGYYFIDTTKEDLEETLKYFQANKILHIKTNANFDPFIFNFLSGTNFGPMNVLVGGGSNDLGEIKPYEQGYKLMMLYFKNIKDELNKYGKQLDAADEAHIMRLIDNLKYYEDIVYDKLKLIANYVSNKDNNLQVALGDKEIRKLADMNKFNLAKENYNLQGDQVINALLLALDKLNTVTKVNEAPIQLI